MSGERLKETARQAGAVGMQAYRDGSGRLWISLPDSRIPAELLSVATALVEYAPKVPVNQETGSLEIGSLLLRVLSWIDRAGVSVRDILQAVRDETGPDEASILAIEVALAQLRPAHVIADPEAPSIAPTAAGHDVELVGAEEAAKDAPNTGSDFFPTPPWASAPTLTSAMMPNPPWSPSSATEAESHTKSHPTPQWLANLLSKPLDNAQDGEDHASAESELDQVAGTNRNEVEALLGRLVDAGSSKRTETPPTASETDHIASNFKDLIERIERAVKEVRDVAPNEKINELTPVEGLLARIQEHGLEAYIAQERATVENISMIGESILSRIAAVALSYVRPIRR